jgi:threonine aldolase
MRLQKADTEATTAERDRQLRAGCAKFISHHRQRSPRETLAALSRHPLAVHPPDQYGSGGAVGELERRVVALLGKQAGVFFAKGVIAQQCLARVRSEERASPYIALSPLGHIDHDEANGLEYLHGLRPVRLGRHGPFALADLQRVRQRLAAVIVELPLRRAGFLLPPWRDLERISAWCRDNEVPLHFDGARLWEAAAGYGRTLRTVAALADSVYVSFYKGPGGLGGCVVAGTRDCIDALEVWRARQGASLWTAYPYALSALDGLDRHLSRMPDYVRRARALAARLRREGICQIHPLDPTVNAFQVILAGTGGELKQRNRDFAARKKVWLFNAFFESPFEGQAIAEIVIGDAADDYSDDEACSWLRQFQAMSGEGRGRAAIRRRVRKPTARRPRRRNT